MANHGAIIGKRGGFPWRAIGWGGAGLLLILPFVAMQLGDAVDWSAGDFIFAAVLLASVGLAIELIVHKSGNASYRLGAALAVIGALLNIWVNGAVGMIGSEDNGYNLLFLGVPMIALLGSVVARFRAGGMAAAMAAAALAQVGIGAGGWPGDPRGALFSMAFGFVWLLAAALLRNAARAD